MDLNTSQKFFFVEFLVVGRTFSRFIPIFFLLLKIMFENVKKLPSKRFKPITNCSDNVVKWVTGHKKVT